MKIIVIATHPDDETLGCGGTLLKHRANKDKIFWLIITGMKEAQGYTKERIAERRKEIDKVKSLYGFDRVYELGIATTQIDRISKSELVAKIGEVFKEVMPNTVYLPFMNDPHSDHRLVFEAAYSCTKSFRYPFIKKVLMMESLSETEFAPPAGACTFIPNYFVNISKFFSAKLKITKVFKSEFKNHPFPRSEKGIAALAAYRGVQAGCDYAEGFMLLKYID